MNLQRFSTAVLIGVNQSIGRAAVAQVSEPDRRMLPSAGADSSRVPLLFRFKAVASIRVLRDRSIPIAS